MRVTKIRGRIGRSDLKISGRMVEKRFANRVALLPERLIARVVFGEKLSLTNREKSGPL